MHAVATDSGCGSARVLGHSRVKSLKLFLLGTHLTWQDDQAVGFGLGIPLTVSETFREPVACGHVPAAALQCD